mmetsp:Transcript_14498/g.36724  ORF Transcript_14498/g.36724 Transcript_14498/m.36724 type:complete len:296 (-) Transcript_14498:193-1080(-)
MGKPSAARPKPPERICKPVRATDPATWPTALPTAGKASSALPPATFWKLPWITGTLCSKASSACGTISAAKRRPAAAPLESPRANELNSPGAAWLCCAADNTRLVGIGGVLSTFAATRVAGFAGWDGSAGGAGGAGGAGFGATLATVGAVGELATSEATRWGADTGGTLARAGASSKFAGGLSTCTLVVVGAPRTATIRAARCSSTLALCSPMPTAAATMVALTAATGTHEASFSKRLFACRCAVKKPPAKLLMMSKGKAPAALAGSRAPALSSSAPLGKPTVGAPAALRRTGEC